MLLILSAVVLVLARWLPPGARRTATTAAGAVLVPTAAALVLLGPRWQMAPVFAGAALAAPFALSPLLRRRTGRRPAGRVRWWWAVPGSAVCLSLIAMGPAAAWALPVPVFPEPSGRYPVGTSVMQWTDPDRPETATADPDDRRTVVGQFWYPAREHPAGAERARYLGRTAREARTVSDALADYAGLPGFLLHGASRAHTRAVPDAEAATGGGAFPVVLFSPGLGGVRTQNTAWAEELASRGYVVVALDHPYDSAAVVLDDGRTIRTKVAATGDDEKDDKLAAEHTKVRAADLGFVLTRLSVTDGSGAPPRLAGRLDTGRVAVTGHSLGGGAALQAAHQDRRFDAVINLDGYPHDPAPRPFRQPALALTQVIGPQTDPDYIPRLTRVLDLGTATSYRLAVPGTAHLTFTDAPLYLPPLPSLVGSPGRTEGPRLTAALCAAFLDTTLRSGQNGPDDLPAYLADHGDLSVHGPGTGS
ncbi:hypothetical protein AB0903_24075 [Streptomyces sp. NPDC048389]|uniref:alpha/beta hydrolase family protein n=1 Tax=Streptomyces sp. NPDC048389 TaxID=3154622 RepID=UPI003452FB5F